ncbi:MAG: GGDEF domain-containing protein [Lachnospiraceae bacterium]|nr:GGDEF domain-containing protein [Lachnospiraceae bacterium]
MSNFSYAAVATMGMNSVSVIFLLVILISSIFQKKEKRAKDKVFILMLVLDITALVLNVLCNILDGNVGLSSFNYMITVVATSLCVPIAGSLVAYTIETVKECGEISPVFTRINKAAVVIFTAVVLIMCLTGQVFLIENGKYVSGPLDYSYMTLVVLTGYIFNTFIIVKHIRALGAKSSITLLMYLVIPLLACIVVFTTGWILIDSIYSCAAVSLTMIYVVLQVDSERRHQEKEKNLNIESTTDTLTGLLNRRAFEEVLSGLGANDHVGVVYCDVNRLKYCNDTFGHTAGDQLLRDFADVLMRVYKRPEIFRISGDEFVVICADEHEVFEEKFGRLEKLVDTFDYRIASLGRACGPAANFEEICYRAEEQMYEDKRAYYKKYPEENRRN